MALVKVQPQPEFVLSKAVLNMQSSMGWSAAFVANVIGVSVSTYSRLPRSGLDPQKKSGQLAVLLIRTYRSLFALMGGDEAHMKKWMNTVNHAFGSEPESLLSEPQGLVRVLEYLDAMRGHA